MPQLDVMGTNMQDHNCPSIAPKLCLCLRGWRYSAAAQVARSSVAAGNSCCLPTAPGARSGACDGRDLPLARARLGTCDACGRSLEVGPCSFCPTAMASASNSRFSPASGPPSSYDAAPVHTGRRGRHGTTTRGCSRTGLFSPSVSTKSDTHCPQQDHGAQPPPSVETGPPSRQVAMKCT